MLQADARRAAAAFPAVAGRVTDVITSPPYLNTTNYREDQWLRLWFLGGEARVPHDRRDDRHYSKEIYWRFVRASWVGLAPLLAESARLVIRIGGRLLPKAEIRDTLLDSLVAGLGRDVTLVGNGVTSAVGNTQAISFRRTKASPIKEHDFCFEVSARKS